MSFFYDYLLQFWNSGIHYMGFIDSSSLTKDICVESIQSGFSDALDDSNVDNNHKKYVSSYNLFYYDGDLMCLNKNIDVEVILPNNYVSVLIECVDLNGNLCNYNILYIPKCELVSCLNYLEKFNVKQIINMFILNITCNSSSIAFDNYYGCKLSDFIFNNIYNDFYYEANGSGFMNIFGCDVNFCNALSEAYSFPYISKSYNVSEGVYVSDCFSFLNKYLTIHLGSFVKMQINITNNLKIITMPSIWMNSPFYFFNFYSINHANRMIKLNLVDSKYNVFSLSLPFINGCYYNSDENLLVFSKPSDQDALSKSISNIVSSISNAFRGLTGNKYLMNFCHGRYQNNSVKDETNDCSIFVKNEFESTSFGWFDPKNQILSLLKIQYDIDIFGLPLTLSLGAYGDNYIIMSRYSGHSYFGHSGTISASMSLDYVGDMFKSSAYYRDVGGIHNHGINCSIYYKNILSSIGRVALYGDINLDVFNNNFYSRDLYAIYSESFMSLYDCDVFSTHHFSRYINSNQSGIVKIVPFQSLGKSFLLFGDSFLDIISSRSFLLKSTMNQFLNAFINMKGISYLYASKLFSLINARIVDHEFNESNYYVGMGITLGLKYVDGGFSDWYTFRDPNILMPIFGPCLSLNIRGKYINSIILSFDLLSGIIISNLF